MLDYCGYEIWVVLSFGGFPEEFTSWEILNQAREDFANGNRTFVLSDLSLGHGLSLA